MLHALITYEIRIYIFPLDGGGYIFIFSVLKSPFCEFLMVSGIHLNFKIRFFIVRLSIQYPKKTEVQPSIL